MDFYVMLRGCTWKTEELRERSLGIIWYLGYMYRQERGQKLF